MNAKLFFLLFSLTTSLLGRQADIPVSCFFEPNQFAQNGVFYVAKELRDIIDNKIKGVRNYELRRSQDWFQRTLIGWRNDVLNLKANLQSAEARFAKDAKATRKVNILNQKIEFLMILIDKLAQALEIYRNDRTNEGLLIDTADATNSVVKDIILEIEQSEKTQILAYFSPDQLQEYGSLKNACQSLIGTRQAGWLVSLNNASSDVIPKRSSIQGEEMPEIYKPNPQVEGEFAGLEEEGNAGRVVGVNLAG